MTGATRRIGRAIAERLGAEGARLALSFRSDENGRKETEARLDAAGVENHWFRADVGVVDDCLRLAEEASAALGGLDMLVNNAAMFRKTPLDTDPRDAAADFDAHMRVNARSVHVLSLAVGRSAGPGGAIVNLADVSAARPWPTHLPYCASKAAVVNLTRGLAKALAPAVRVNAVAPGFALPPADEEHSSGATGGLIAGHAGADAVAAAVAFLLRAPYLTGVVLEVG